MLIVTLALALVPLACGDRDDDAEPPRPPTTTAATTPSPQESALAGYLEENFGPGSGVGQTSWYDSITSIECCSAFDGKATVEVTTFSEADASSICTAVMLSGVDGVAGANIMNREAGKLAECP